MKILIDGQTLHTPEINRGIGTYFKNIIKAVFENDLTSEFYINLADRTKLRHLPKWIQEKSNVIVNSNYDPSLAHGETWESFSSIYSETINADLQRYGIDIYWNPNPLMDNVFLPIKQCNCRFVSTVYDLIPLILKDVYFNIWPKFVVDMYTSKLKILEQYYDMFLHISRNTEADFKKALKVDGKKHIVTPLAASAAFHPYPFPKVPVKEDYVLYVGGDDPRKNMYKAVDAFAKLQNTYNKDAGIQNTKLYIVCSLDEHSRKKFTNHAETLGIKNKIKLTGFIDDNALISIYQRARAFFFPSLYEGFGLPVLEALAAGLPVASANNSSILEVGGEMVIYFDAQSTEGMADALYKVLQEPVDSESRCKRYKYTQNFLWEKAGGHILEAFENLIVFKPIHMETARKKIAWLSPLPPQKSGIAHYSDILIKELKNHLDIDLYYDGEKPFQEIYNNFNIYPIREFVGNFKNYDEVVYHLGNNSVFHTNIYKIAWEFPGIIVLHDYNIHPFMQHSFLGTKDEYLYKSALIEGYGDEGEEEFKEIKKRGCPDIWKFSMSHAIVNRSKKVIVHHLWQKKQFPADKNIKVIPHFAETDIYSTENDIESFKKTHKIDNRYFIVSCLGFINKNKLPELQIAVINKLIDNGYPVIMLFAGELPPGMMHLKTAMESSKYAFNYKFTGYQDKKDYINTIFASDIIINLRNPTMGEASGTLMQALAAGKPVIVSDINQYKEFPDNVCWKVPPDGNEEEYLYRFLEYLFKEMEVREKLGRQSKAFAAQMSVRNVALKYIRELL